MEPQEENTEEYLIQKKKRKEGGEGGRLKRIDGRLRAI